MNRGATLARVIGLTRSFPSLAFERGGKGDGPEAEAAAVAAEAIVPADGRTAAPTESAAIVQVTTVEAETAAPPDGLFDEIEADMASLLATIDEIGDRPAAEAAAVDDDDEMPISALLSELNRLWLAESAERTIN